MNRRHWLPAAVVLGCWPAYLAGSSPAAVQPAPCGKIDLAGVRCASLRLPENRTAPAGRSIDLFVAVLPATGAERLPDPIFFFYGGPGTAASDEIARTANDWRGMRGRRDLVFIDQRGTGRSAPLHCGYDGDPKDPNTFAIDLFDPRHLGNCLARHSPSHDLKRYGTSDAIEDAEAVRAALGYERINLAGESYGTRVVQEYLRRHPQRARTALLLGAVPPSASITEGMAASLNEMLGQLFDSCEADRACAQGYPDLRAQATTWLERLRSGTVTAEISLDGAEPRSATIDYHLALAWIRSRLYSVIETARLPRILSLAARGDARELVRGAIHWRRGLSRLLSEGMYASVACAEDMPFVNVRAETEAAKGTWLGDHRLASQQTACGNWPRATVADDFKRPLPSTTPLLVINGDRDPATSLDWANRAVAGAPARRLVVARNRSHHLGFAQDDCLGPIAARFVDTADPAAVDASCAARLVLPPFDIERANREPPTKRVPADGAGRNADGTMHLESISPQPDSRGARLN